MIRTMLAFLFLFQFIQIGNSQVKFPLLTGPDKHYLIDANGNPFPILGRTAWCLVSQTEKNYKAFLDNTLSYGFNAIEIAVIMHWPAGNHTPFNARHEAPFLKQLDGKDWTGNLKYSDKTKEAPDLLTPNEAYWRFVDSLLLYCEQKGIAVLMFPGYVGWNGGDQGWMQELVANGTVRTESYGRWFAERYKNRSNIIWMLLGDKGEFNKEDAEAERALIRGLKSVKGQSSVQYSAESHSCENAADNGLFGLEMTLNGVYTWDLFCPVPRLARKGYMHGPTMPAFLLEEPYDEEGPDGSNFNPSATQPVRRFQWWGWLSSIGGYVAGNGYIWPFIDPVWQAHLNTQGVQDMGRLNRFIQSVPWWQLVPDGLNGTNALVISPANSDTTASYIAAAATPNGKYIVAYIPPDFTGEFTINVSGLSGPSKAYWIDPTSENRIELNGTIDPAKRSHTFIVPGKNSRMENDWVLLIKQD